MIPSDYRFCPVRKAKSSTDAESPRAPPAKETACVSSAPLLERVEGPTQPAIPPVKSRAEGSPTRPGPVACQPSDVGLHRSAATPLPEAPVSAPLESTGWTHDSYGPFVSVFENTFIHPQHSAKASTCDGWEYEVRSPQWFPHSAPAATAHFTFQEDSPYHPASSYEGSIHDYFFDENATDNELPSPATTADYPSPTFALEASFAQPGPDAATTPIDYFQYQFPTLLPKPQYHLVQSSEYTHQA
ncbi:hypothetical protein T439DRAFT_26332 [Meredithblackwellia eburnea MCA 4105]